MSSQRSTLAGSVKSIRVEGREKHSVEMPPPPPPPPPRSLLYSTLLYSTLLCSALSALLCSALLRSTLCGVTTALARGGNASLVRLRLRLPHRNRARHITISCRR